MSVLSSALYTSIHVFSQLSLLPTLEMRKLKIELLNCLVYIEAEVGFMPSLPDSRAHLCNQCAARGVKASTCLKSWDLYPCCHRHCLSVSITLLLCQVTSGIPVPHKMNITAVPLELCT